MNTLASMIAEKLTKPQRDLLIAHIDRAVPITIANCTEGKTRGSLIARALLRKVQGNRATALTPLGRVVVCSVLGDYAEKLIQAEQRGLDRRYYGRQARSENPTVCATVRPAIIAMKSNAAVPDVTITEEEEYD